MLLAIDTATQMISLALYDGQDILAEVTWRTANHHTVELTPALVEIFSRTGITLGDLEGVALALGPGSFTGLRIGLGVAKGLALAARQKLSLIGISTLDVVATTQLPLVPSLCAIVQAGRGRVSAGFYRWGTDAWQAEGRPFIAEWGQVAEQITEPVLVCGELDLVGRAMLAERAQQAILPGPSSCLRRAGHLAELGWKRLSAGQIDDPATLAPIYLHDL